MWSPSAPAAAQSSGAAHPGGGHAERGGRDQVLGHVLDHQRASRADLVARAAARDTPASAGFGSNPAAAMSTMPQNELAMPRCSSSRSACGTEPLVWTILRPGSACQRRDQHRVGRHAGEVDIVDIGHEIRAGRPGRPSSARASSCRARGNRFSGRPAPPPATAPSRSAIKLCMRAWIWSNSRHDAG